MPKINEAEFRELRSNQKDETKPTASAEGLVVLIPMM